MTFNETIVREEQLNEHVNWIIAGAMLGTALGFIIFCILMLVKAYTAALVIQLALMVIGALAGIPLQVDKKKRLNS